MTSEFGHLHVHSDFSVQDAILPVARAVEVAAARGDAAIALTDHGSMAGIVKHYQACRRAGIRPIPGVEAYLVADPARHQEEVKAACEVANAAARARGERRQATNWAREASQLRRHVLLLARSWAGYRALVDAVTRSHRQAYGRPLLGLEDLWELGQTGEVWTTTGCLNGWIPKALARGDRVEAQRHLSFLRSAFGARLAVELQVHGLADERAVNPWLWEAAQAAGYPVVATGDVHYLEAADQPAHEFFKRISYAKDVGEVGFEGTGYHLATRAELLRSMAGVDDDGADAPLPSAVPRACAEGIDHVLRDCRDVRIPALDAYSYAVPEVAPRPMRALIQLCRRRLEALELGPEYQERLRAELRVIQATGFAHYFLLVALVTRFCREREIFCVARGSASGSLVCYLLQITQLDPLAWGLLFERFLSNDRSKPPDIDLDVEDDRRDEVLAYVSQRYQTTQIGTFGTFADRSAKNEVLAQLRREGRVSEDCPVEDLATADPEGHRWLRAITGLRRTQGGHPAGVIAETPARPVAGIVPLAHIASSGRWVTQFDMDDVEALGYVKVDILGLRSLRTVRRCLRLLGMASWDEIPDHDPPTWELLGRGDTAGVFTFKGWAAQKGCKQLRPRSVEDCALVAAIWRPSCMELGLDQLFLERRRARWRPPADEHPALAEVLAPTYGIAVYQEQVIAIMRRLGFSADDVMTMLRAVKKKDERLMAQVFERLREVAPELEGRLRELMEGYTRYGFNKSHAAAYGLFGYRMAYLKANHPLEFMCAVLQCEQEKTDQARYAREARALGLKLLPADVLASELDWGVERGRLRRGLVSVTGVGEKAAAALVEGRPFANLEELRARVHPVRCNAGVLKKLAAAGAFRTMGLEDADELTRELERIELDQKAAAKAARQAAREAKKR